MFKVGDTVWFYRGAGFTCCRHKKKKSDQCHSNVIEQQGTVAYVFEAGTLFPNSVEYVIRWESHIDSHLEIRNDWTCHAEQGKDLMWKLRQRRATT